MYKLHYFVLNYFVFYHNLIYAILRSKIIKFIQQSILAKINYNTQRPFYINHECHGLPGPQTFFRPDFWNPVRLFSQPVKSLIEAYVLNKQVYSSFPAANSSVCLITSIVKVEARQFWYENVSRRVGSGGTIFF